MTNQLNTMEVLMQLLRAYMGTGILAMPKAFSYSGIILGLIGTPLIGILCNSCIHMLIDINQHFCRKFSSDPMDFEELAEKSLQHGPLSLRRFARCSRNIVILLLVLTKLGYCCSFYLFIGQNIQKFLTNIWPNLLMTVPDYMLIILPVLMIINFVKSIKWLSIASTCANTIQVLTLSIIIYNLVQNISTTSDRKLFGTEISMFLSTTVYTFEGITSIMPLYRSAKNRNNFDKPFGVINCALIFVILLYSTIGLLGYIKYGSEVGAVITLSLPDQPLYNSVEILYCLVLCVSFQVHMSVAVNQLWPFIENHLEIKINSDFNLIMNLIFRAFLVLITYAFTTFIPKLELIIALVGAVSCSSIALVMPPILHSITFWESDFSQLKRMWLHIRNGSILLFGIIILIMGSYFCIKDISNVYPDQTNHHLSI